MAMNEPVTLRERAWGLLVYLAWRISPVLSGRMTRWSARREWARWEAWGRR
jgi:hypothetical protein